MHTDFRDNEFNDWVVRRLPPWFVQELREAYSHEDAFERAVSALSNTFGTLRGHSRLWVKIEPIAPAPAESTEMSEQDIEDFEAYLDKKYPDSKPEKS